MPRATTSFVVPTDDGPRMIAQGDVLPADHAAVKAVPHLFEDDTRTDTESANVDKARPAPKNTAAKKGTVKK